MTPAKTRIYVDIEASISTRLDNQGTIEECYFSAVNALGSHWWYFTAHGRWTIDKHHILKYKTI